MLASYNTNPPNAMRRHLIGWLAILRKARGLLSYPAERPRMKSLEAELRKLYRQKSRFCKKKIGLKPEKAREWALRVVKVRCQTIKEKLDEIVASL